MKICVFASGSGTNFQAILKAKSEGIIKSDISLLITNNSLCGAVDIAKNFNVDVFHISRKVFSDITDADYANVFLNKLEEYGIDFIVLAGYMKMLEPAVTEKFARRIINIHPALLPSFGGKGMFGVNVHKAVIESGAKSTGITVHAVNEHYDSGKILFQTTADVLENDDEYSLQKRILELEHKYYPFVISEIENGRIKLV